MESKVPLIKTQLPGPEARKILALDQRIRLALLHAGLPHGGQAGARRER